MSSNYNSVGKSEKYKYVYKYEYKTKGIKWLARIRQKVGVRYRKLTKYYDEEKEAARAVDMFLISIGKDPINVLKRKNEQEGLIKTDTS